MTQFEKETQDFITCSNDMESHLIFLTENGGQLADEYERRTSKTAK